MAALPEPIPKDPPPQVVRDSQEFVPGRANFSFLNSLTARLLNLPDPQTLSWDQIDLMRFDAVIDAGIEVIKDIVLAEGIQIAPATCADEDTEKALEYSKFIERALPQTFTSVLEGLLEAIYYGHAIAELIYHTSVEGEDKGKLLLKAVKLKDRDAIEIVVDKFWNIQGLRATTLPGDHIFPRVKFLILTLRKVGEDPRGRTSLRSAFSAWRFKQEIWPTYIRYMKTCAIPSIIGKLPPKAAPQAKLNAVGSIILDSEGNPTMVHPADAMLDALLQMENATACVLANGSEVEVLEVSDNGSVYEKALDLANNEITTALLRQTRATAEAQHGSKADSETGRSVLSYLIIKLRQKVATAINEDIIRPMMLWNFGQEAMPLAPHAALGETDRYDWSTDADAAAKLAPLVTDSQWNQITEMLGLKPPQEGEEAPSRTPPPPVAVDPNAKPGEPGAPPKPGEKPAPGVKPVKPVEKVPPKKGAPAK